MESEEKYCNGLFPGYQIDPKESFTTVDRSSGWKPVWSGQQSELTNVKKCYLFRFLKSQNEDGKGRQDKSRYITEDKGGREDKVPLCEDQDREKKNSVLDIRLEGDMPSVRQMSDRDRSTAETV